MANFTVSFFSTVEHDRIEEERNRPDNPRKQTLSEEEANRYFREWSKKLLSEATEYEMRGGVAMFKDGEPINTIEINSFLPLK